jgi:hypothetical protein
MPLVGKVILDAGRLQQLFESPCSSDSGPFPPPYGGPPPLYFVPAERLEQHCYTLITVILWPQCLHRVAEDIAVLD